MSYDLNSCHALRARSKDTSVSRTHITFGHDDSRAGNLAVAAAVARGDRFLYVPGASYVPDLSNLVSRIIRSAKARSCSAHGGVTSSRPNAAGPSAAAAASTPRFAFGAVCQKAAPVSSVVIAGDSVSVLGSNGVTVNASVPATF